jgi:hypothetical protein
VLCFALSGGRMRYPHERVKLTFNADDREPTEKLLRDNLENISYTEEERKSFQRTLWKLRGEYTREKQYEFYKEKMKLIKYEKHELPKDIHEKIIELYVKGKTYTEIKDLLLVKKSTINQAVTQFRNAEKAAQKKK